MNNITSTRVIFTRIPSMERPLFLLQYESDDPARAPSPADFPSCIRIKTVNAIHMITNTIVNIVFNTATIYTSYFFLFLRFTHNLYEYNTVDF